MADTSAVELRTTLYRRLLLPRLIEEKMLRLIRQGRISKWFSGYGQEAISVGCVAALREDDYILPLHRNLGAWTSRDVPLRPLFCQLMGRAGGFTKGRDRTFHFGLPEKRIVGMISHLGAMLPVACGLGLAARLDATDAVALAFTGEGATREGDFHEALSLASLWHLPVIFVVENNLYGLSTPAHEAVPIEDLADAASGYGMPGVVVDGNDVEAVRDAVLTAADRARRGEGPSLLEMKTFRMRGHEEASGTKYVPAELFERWAERDPVATFRTRLFEEGLLDEAEDVARRRQLEQEIDAAAEFALAQPEVESDAETELRDVFAQVVGGASMPVNGLQDEEAVPPSRRNGEGALRPDTARVRTDSTMRFVDAVSDGLRTAMRRDPRVLLLGQDVAEYGGVFKVTEGFLEEFGPERVRNTPIIESGALGAALGLALGGYRPVVEMQYADFIAVGFNQIVNNLATTHYRWGAPVNVTIRAPFGGYSGAGPFHSQSMEAWFAHVPGLKVVVPATPADARGLLLAAIEDPNPVLFFEHKHLYRSLKGAVPEDASPIPLGAARVAVEGDAMTIVTYGLGVVWAEEEAEFWRTRGVALEVVDLRTVAPWDRQTVIDSVRKTNRLLVLHEAPRNAGFGAEIAATVAESAFLSLDAPPVRVAGLETPIPFGKRLEQEVYAARTRLRPAVEALLGF